MTEPDPFARPGTTPTPRRRRPAFAGPRDEVDVPPLDHIAPDLDPPWSKEDTDTPDRTAAYQHPEGHRVGLRVQSRGLAIQTWITAGPDLPPIPDGTDMERAEAQAVNDARLQPGRTWHAVLATRTSKALAADLGVLVCERLLPALTNKPRGIPAPAPPARIGQPDTAPQKEGTQK
ncbi:hypothetical protein GTZ78_12715 [Streptomyces sp. SID8361]|uniref:hypothetical protein n=1 Tax=Streptomyces sp. MnatMP-M27 TaxID=1839768 RepID=UPI00081EAFFF|nr:hypothetical protein [Streptomyces sp. MnatMP-M27]MYU11542.1 hypothetical protein [Streptomyces sp. SID8361]SCF82459.1 hypothetical protein GA0115260_1028962 [Streptomyces sp. MnatMP-M27]